jgi:hypothetical protein
MLHFDMLRTIPWKPSFVWVSTIAEAADKINLPHEDYPKRADATVIQLLGMKQYFEMLRGKLDYDILPITNYLLKTIHADVFQDTNFAGKWREYDVTVGMHRPPDYGMVVKLMGQLEILYEDKEFSIEMLQNWYIDFETIHPFPDGNGRVGGIVVASYTHLLCPDKGWLAPEQ